MIETHQLRCFIAVAEELHFGRAAKRLNMSQPPVSRQIQMLERALNCTLFERTKRSVKLNEAGAVFLPEARRILAMMEQAAATANAVASGRKGTVRFGFTATAAYSFLPILLRALRRDMPDARLSLREMVSLDQLACLDAREIDIALTRAPVSLTALEHRLIWREPLVAALPKGNALARRKTISWRDLHRQDFVMFEPKEGAYFHNLIMGRLALEGIFPDFVHYLSQTHTILSLVRAGVGVAVVPASAKLLDFSEIEFRDFAESRVTASELHVAWRPDTANPVVPKIAEMAVACRNFS